MKCVVFFASLRTGKDNRQFGEIQGIKGRPSDSKDGVGHEVFKYPCDSVFARAVLNAVVSAKEPVLVDLETDVRQWNRGESSHAMVTVVAGEVLGGLSHAGSQWEFGVGIFSKGVGHD